MYGGVEKKEYKSLLLVRKQQIWEGYRFNWSMDSYMLGGRLGEGLKWLDWLGSASRFGGLVASEAFVKDHCGDALPHTFELKCLLSYPLTAEEVWEQRRLENPLCHQSRSQPATSQQQSPRSATVHTGNPQEIVPAKDTRCTCIGGAHGFKIAR